MGWDLFACLFVNLFVRSFFCILVFSCLLLLFVFSSFIPSSLFIYLLLLLLLLLLLFVFVFVFVFVLSFVFFGSTQCSSGHRILCDDVLESMTLLHDLCYYLFFMFLLLRCTPNMV